MKQLFTSESVTEGHPDKICDQISDAVLDAILAQDPYARVACETCTTTGIVIVMGEVTTTADYRREGRNQYNKGSSHPYTGQRIGSNSRNMSDVYTVDNAIKQIDKLCGYCRKSHFKNKR